MSDSRGGSLFEVAPSSASAERVSTTPTAGARPRAVRSSLISHSSCVVGLRSVKLGGRTSGPSPSWARAVSIASTAALSQVGPSGPALMLEAQIEAKFGVGAMLAGGSASAEAGGGVDEATTGGFAEDVAGGAADAGGLVALVGEGVDGACGVGLGGAGCDGDELRRRGGVGIGSRARPTRASWRTMAASRDEVVEPVRACSAREVAPTPEVPATDAAMMRHIQW